MKKTRNSRIEFLRILSMIMILIAHYSTHNGINNNTLPLGINRYLLEIVTIGNIGPILFILITGYFSINNKNPFKLKKLVLLLLQVLFYSISIYVLFVLFGLTKFSIKGIIKNCFPITFKNYWFMTTYIILYLLIPYINALINSLNKKEHFRLIIINIIIFSIIPTITNQNLYLNELIEFIMYYIIGAYFGKFNKSILNKKRMLMKLFICLGVALLSVFLLDILGNNISILSNHSTYFLKRKSIIILLLSILIFNIAIIREPKENKIINFISNYVLGVYLISDNYLIRSILWTKILRIDNYINTNYLLIHMLVSISIIFILCILIHYLYSITIEKIINVIYNKISTKIKHTK